MKLTIEHDPNVTEPEITVVYGHLSRELEELLACISLADDHMVGAGNGETHFVKFSDILYFETVDRKVFFYTEADTYETKAKIYQIEEKLQHTSFARISKSVIANLHKICSIQPEKHSRLCATLQNGEKLIVSRQYLGTIKEKLGV